MANRFQRYNHSYNHCTGEGCEHCVDCIHYLAYQEALDLGLKDIKTVCRIAKTSTLIMSEYR